MLIITNDRNDQYFLPPIYEKTNQIFLDSLQMALRGENYILVQIYKNKFVRMFIIKILIFINYIKMNILKSKTVFIK